MNHNSFFMINMLHKVENKCQNKGFWSCLIKFPFVLLGKNLCIILLTFILITRYPVSCLRCSLFTLYPVYVVYHANVVSCLRCILSTLCSLFTLYPANVVCYLRFITFTLHPVYKLSCHVSGFRSSYIHTTLLNILSLDLDWFGFDFYFGIVCFVDDSIFVTRHYFALRIIDINFPQMTIL